MLIRRGNKLAEIAPRNRQEIIKGVHKACTQRGTTIMSSAMSSAPYGKASAAIWVAITVAITLAGLLLVASTSYAQVPVLALPEVNAPPAGDPRLEPIPGFPIHLVNFKVFGTDITSVAGASVELTMRFPPRVNGQNQSDGDKHADMFVLFYADTGQRVPQRPVVEAVPKPLTASDLKARQFSAIWELHAVLVDPLYNPNDPSMLIDSGLKVETSLFVKQILQTNIFLNCPIVPNGTTIDAVPGGPVANEPRVMEAFFEGQIVSFVPYDIEDGGFNPQMLFIFKTPDGSIVENTLNPGMFSPHIVAAKAPGEPFYSSIWELWVVTVPDAATALGITQATQITKGGIVQPGLKVASAGIRLNCPVVAIGGVAFPFEDAFAILDALIHPNGVYNPTNRTPIHLPQAQFTASRTFLITEVNPGGAPLEAAGSVASDFPAITPDGPLGSDKGNVIPVILKDPFHVNPAGAGGSINFSGPNTNGPRHRIVQAELDAGLAINRLPEAIETNVANLISAGLLAPEWGPGGRPYQERLGQLVGRAIFEMVWRPEDGANQKDVTSCLACHSTSHSGGAARGLYTLRPDSERGGAVNPGSMWGGGTAERLRELKIAAGATGCSPAGAINLAGTNCITFAHGTTGTIAGLRGVTVGAFNAHMGMQTVEFIMGPVTAANGKAKCDLDHNGTIDLAEAKVCDLDGDGVIEELSVGEVTAVAVFFAGLPVPRQARDDDLMPLLGVTKTTLNRGRDLFRLSIDKGAARCAACHTQFHPLSDTTLTVSNPETSGTIPVQVSYHTAHQLDVNDGLATVVGEPGVRLYGDFRLHKMGPLMKNGKPARDVMKTAELWDAGSVFPWGRDGRWGGTQMRDAILAHEGVSLTGVTVTRSAPVTIVQGTKKAVPISQNITITNNSGLPLAASPTTPIRVVLTGPMSNDITLTNADGTAPDGGLRQGAFKRITTGIAAGGSVVLTLTFNNPQGVPLIYGLTIQNHDGYSEAVASAQAFKALATSDQNAVIDFLRAQLIGGKVGEGSGLVVEGP